MRYTVRIEIEDEVVGEIVYNSCPPVPPIGARIIASDVSLAPEGILAELEFSFREGECQIGLLCDQVPQPSLMPR